jgi:hypothetical protein
LATFEEELRALEHKLNTLKLDYDRYFLGSRPREPVVARAEIQKIVTIWSNQPIQNTSLRFKFNSINARYQALKRQWDAVLRQMEAGTYKRDIFKANLRGSSPVSGSAADAAPEGVTSAEAGERLLDSYLDAARACGQSVKGLTAKKLQAVVDKQTAALRKKLGCKDVSFRVTVQDGKVKLKASPVRA